MPQKWRGLWRHGEETSTIHIPCCWRWKSPPGSWRLQRAANYKRDWEDHEGEGHLRWGGIQGEWCVFVCVCRGVKVKDSGSYQKRVNRLRFVQTQQISGWCYSLILLGSRSKHLQLKAIIWLSLAPGLIILVKEFHFKHAICGNI